MIDRGVLDVAAVRSFAIATAFRQSAPYRALEAAFAGADDAETLAAAAEAVLASDRWVGVLIAPLIAALRPDPWFEPPFRVARDGLRIGAVLYEASAVSITATILSADALALLPAPRTVVVPGRLTVTRYVKSGGARMRLWEAEVADADFTAHGAGPVTPLPSLPLCDGQVLRLDGRRYGHLLDDARHDVVTLSATIRADASPFMREYAIADGALARLAMLDDRAARTQMLLAMVRLAGRHDAGDRFEAATHDAAFFLRWAAMREWLALDARAALPRLRIMASEDQHHEVRAAASATLAQVETRMDLRIAA